MTLRVPTQSFQTLISHGEDDAGYGRILSARMALMTVHPMETPEEVLGPSFEPAKLGVHL